MLDVVYNHLGPAGNYLSEFGPYFTDLYQTPWGSAVNLDGAGELRSPRLRYLQCSHVADATTTSDGLRLDAVHAIFDESALAHTGGAGGRGRRGGQPNWAGSCG